VSPEALTIPTTEGNARARVTTPDAAPTGAVMIGHGAGGGVDAPDLRTAARTALQAGWAVALVEQPYRVAGRRSPVPAPRLDTAWVQAAEVLAAAGGPLDGLRLVTGGRSSGARVACRTAMRTGAIGVLCLAFPLQPTGRAGSDRESPSRQPELDGAGVPVLVVQGRSDRFGMPDASVELDRIVMDVDGDHGLKRDHTGIDDAIDGWLRALPAAVARPRTA
jgi:predicted alpha/beta-hydrolase family hydrolase